MNFNFGEVLTRAAQITWKHKNLWLAGIVVSLFSFLSVPISLLFNPSMSSFSDPSEVNRALPAILLANGLILLVSILAVPLSVFGMSVPSLGTFHIEQGWERINFGGLLKAVLPYFWRVLGVFLLVWVGTMIVMMALMLLLMLLSLLTFGLGMLCAIPLFILFIPAAILVYALMEQAISAVLVDNLGFSNALQRAWDLVKKNLGVMALISVIIYIGGTMISMIIVVPMLIPMFGFIFNMGADPNLQSVETLTRNMNLWMLAFSPLYAVLQGILLTYMQSVWTLTYMRLTRSTKPSQPLLGTVEAAI